MFFVKKQPSIIYLREKSQKFELHIPKLTAKKAHVLTATFVSADERILLPPVQKFLLPEKRKDFIYACVPRIIHQMNKDLSLVDLTIEYDIYADNKRVYSCKSAPIKLKRCR